MKKVVICTLAVVGFHAWPEAPEEVLYLRDVHRHVFGVRVEVLVEGSNREVEFHILKREATSVLIEFYTPHMHNREVHFGNHSCEMIAEVVGDGLRRAGFRVSAVEVDEDGENAGRIEWGV
jgi:hypothetical protein